jgi:hypothetical protein
MRVHGNMKIEEVLKINDRMVDAFVWLSPDFKRLRNPLMRRTMGERVTVEQAARSGGVPLTEALYLLNIAAGENLDTLMAELQQMPNGAHYVHDENPYRKPGELAGLSDDDPRVHFVDVISQADRNEDPMPAIMRALIEWRDADEVILVHHRFNPIPLRDLFAGRGFASWAEERHPHDWYIYFYVPSAKAGAAALPAIMTESVRAMAAEA